MRFKVDENLPREATALLLSAGHDAMSVLDQRMGGTPDPDLYAICQQERRVLVTLDLDFSNIRAYPPRESAGIIVLRPGSQDKLTVVQVIDRLLPLLDRQSPAGALWLVGKERVRMRS
jgi:predicted nuclease of predicted toxin-antitoxin system